MYFKNMTPNETPFPPGVIIEGSIDKEKNGNDDTAQRLSTFRNGLDTDGLTDEDYAEYRSLCMFPSNKRGQELTKKFFTRTLTSEERKEWTSLKNAHHPKDPNIIKLESQTENGDSNVKKVEMNGCDTLPFSSSETQDKIIWTASLAGCFAVATIIEYEDGTGAIQLLHSQPMMIEKLLSNLEEHQPRKKVKIKKALILVEEDHVKDPESKKWKRSLKKDKLDYILETIKNRIGDDTQIKTEPYLSSAHVDIDRDRSLVIKKSHTGNTTYQTWYDDEKEL